MSRVGDSDTSQIFLAAERWRNDCLIGGRSLFWPERVIWSAANLQRYKACFIDKPDTSAGRNFEQKFEDQLAPEGEDVTRLACELLFIYFLFPSPSSIGPYRKKEVIRLVASWKDIKIADDDPIFSFFGSGIGDPGQVYHPGRPNELTYLARVAIRFSELGDDKLTVLHDHKQFRELLDSLGDEHREEFGRPPQLRHVLLYLLFPDDYERIASEGHKVRIAQAFAEVIDGPAPEDLDDQIREIRRRLEALLPNKDLDFYWEPLRQCWYTEGESDTISPLQALDIKKQIVLYGPPGTGKTFQAGEIANSLMRRQLLKLWGPRRFFSSPEAISEIVRRRIDRVQFHPGYGYEDFIRGLQIGAGGQTEYQPGVLLRIIELLNGERAEDHQIPFILILDEMNRADLSKVLGECFTLLEDRDSEVHLGGHDDKPVRIRLPANLYFIGTMNLIDQSLEQVDFALHRRFLWFLRGFSREDFLTVAEKRWQDLVEEGRIRKTWGSVAEEFEDLANRAERLNREIEQTSYLGRQYNIGHTYFCDVVLFAKEFLTASTRRRNRVLFNRAGNALEPVVGLWRYAIAPLLERYLSGIDAVERDALMRRSRSILLEPAA
jgi:5-methylcytosine-specific restriction enzyme B